MKMLKVLAYFILGGVIGFAINYTWSIQQNSITFSLAYILYLAAGYFFSKESAAFLDYKLPLLFWYIFLLICYAIYVNYSWDLPVLLILCIAAYVLGFYLRKQSKRKNKIFFLSTSILIFFTWIYFAVPWITYNSKSTNDNLIAHDKIEFSLFDLEHPSKFVSNADLEGKVVLLDFWFRKCGACMRQYPQIEKVYEHFKDNQNVKIYFVNSGIDDIASINGFIEKQGIQVPVLIDQNSVLCQRLGVLEFPQYLLLDKKGKVREVHIGYSQDEISVFEKYTIEKIETMLKEE
jgi:peroxiredoxin